MDTKSGLAEGVGGARETRPALRQRLLDLAFREMYQNGFAGLRIDALIEKAGSTKGAFYHHFPSKTALGYTVIDEVLAGYADDIWDKHLNAFEDPIQGIEESARYAMTEIWPEFGEFGCPFNNLAQEMSATDAGFRQRTGGLFARIVAHIAEALRRGQHTGHVRADIDPLVTAHFVIAAIEGTIGLVKAIGTTQTLENSLEGMRNYLDTLRPDGGPTAP